MQFALVDVLDGSATGQAINTVVEHSGGVNGFVHCAGVVNPEPVGYLTEEGWGAVLDVNLRAHALLVQQLLPHLKAAAASNQRPSVVAISSIEAIVANPFIPAY